MEQWINIIFTIGMIVLIIPAILILATFLRYATLRTVMGTDVGIIPQFWGDIRMRGHAENNGTWAE